MNNRIFFKLIGIVILFGCTAKAVIFSGNTAAVNWKDWADPRTQMKFELSPGDDPSTTEITPELRGVGTIKVSATLYKAPNEASQADKKMHKEHGTLNYTTEGTGFMINKCLMLTAAHLITLKTTESNVVANESHQKLREIHVALKNLNGSTSNKPILTPAILIAMGEHRPDDKYGIEDWAVLKVENYTDDPKATMPLFELPRDKFPMSKMPEVLIFSSLKNMLNIAGYYPDLMTFEDSKVFGEKKCNVYDNDNKDGLTAWTTDCASMPGTSGAPIYIKVPGKEAVFSIGIMVRSFGVKVEKGDEEHENKAFVATSTIHNSFIPIALDPMYSKLKKIIADNPCN